jgi:hypothetical protein
MINAQPEPEPMLEIDSNVATRSIDFAERLKRPLRWWR